MFVFNVLLLVQEYNFESSIKANVFEVENSYVTHLLRASIEAYQISTTPPSSTLEALWHQTLLANNRRDTCNKHFYCIIVTAFRVPCRLRYIPASEEK